MRSHRAALVFSLPVVLLGLLLSAQPARAAWKAVGYEVEYTYTAPFSETVKKNVLDKDLGLIVYTVGKRTLQTEAGWVTATAECYSNALPNGHPVAYEFGLGGDADKRLKIKLEATGPSGPRPPTWLQQSYCHSESHHDLVQYPDDQGNLPSPWWGIEWRSNAWARNHQDTFYIYKDWYDGNWFGEWAALDAITGWDSVTTGWFIAAKIAANVSVNCRLSSGSIKAQANHWRKTWGAYYK